MKRWVRRNRWGLAVLPLAVAVALAGTARHVQTYWYEADLRVAYRAEPGGEVTIRSGYDDGYQRYPIRPTLRLQSATKVSTVTSNGRQEPVTPVAGATVWKVVLGVTADPNMILTGCTVALSDGSRRWEAGLDAAHTKASVIGSSCVPAATPGPQWLPNTPSPVVDANEVRPAQYTVENYVVTSADAAVSEVLVWWGAPQFAVLPVTSPGG